MGMMGIIDEPQDRLQRIGNIKMGRKGKPQQKVGSDDTYRLPEKFDHFEITTMERDENDDWKPDKDMMALLGKEPKSIPVMLPFDEAMDIFPHEFAWWKSSRRMCHGNGVVGLRYDEKTDKENQMECRCEKFTGDGGEKRVCKKNGILNVIITASGRIGGVYQLRTTGGATISNIKASINLIKSFTGGPVAGIPLMLTIQKQWAYPIVKGVKQKVEIYVAGLEFRADMSLKASPTEQLLERAGVQIQARLSVGKDMKQIEQFSGGINKNTPGDRLDWDQEFGEGAGPQDIEGKISGKTDEKVSALSDRLEGATEADYQDEPPQQTEPTTEEIKQNLRTEIETLLENDLLPKAIVEKTTEWLKKGRQIKGLEGTRDKLNETIDKCEQQQSEEKEESEETLRKEIRADIAKLMDTDVLPKAVVEKMTEWLKDQGRSAHNLKAGKASLIATIKTYEQQAAAALPEETSNDEEKPGKKEVNQSLVELGSRIIDMLGKAREDGLATEHEHSAVFDETDRLETAEELQDLYERWELEIDDRRLIRGEEKKQAGAK